jgi:hypothetical protein
MVITLNALLIYNPQNQQYYEPDSYRLDSYCLPSLVYSSIAYNEAHVAEW